MPLAAAEHAFERAQTTCRSTRLDRYGGGGRLVAIEIAKRRTSLILSRYPKKQNVGPRRKQRPDPARTRPIGLAMELLAVAVNGSIRATSGRPLIEWSCRLLAKGRRQSSNAWCIWRRSPFSGHADYRTFGIDGLQTNAPDISITPSRVIRTRTGSSWRVFARHELRVIARTGWTLLISCRRVVPPSKDRAKRLGETFDLLTALDGLL